jgi:hypothetical protein
MTTKNSNRIQDSAYKAIYRNLCAQAFSDPAFHSIQNARERRYLSRTHIAWSLLLSLVFDLLTSGMMESWFSRNLGFGATTAAVISFVIVVVCLGFWILTTGLLNASVGGATELHDRYLDEAQRALRDAAYRKAYWFVALAAIVIWLTLQAIGFETVKILTRVWFLLVIIIVCAPVHIMALTMPDSNFEDEIAISPPQTQ